MLCRCAIVQAHEIAVNRPMKHEKGQVWAPPVALNHSEGALQP